MADRVESHSISTPEAVREFDSSHWSTGDFNLVATGPSREQAARSILIVTGSGTLVTDQDAVDNEPLTVVEKEEILGRFRAIKQATTGITRVRISW